MTNVMNIINSVNKRKASLITIYGLTHALVDFCSAAIVYSFIGQIETIDLSKNLLDILQKFLA